MALGSHSLQADTISAVGGLGFGRDSGMNDVKTSNPLLGMEYTFDLMSKLQLGGFYDYNFLTESDGHAGSIRFMGSVFRFEAAKETQFSPFVDAKLGMGNRTEEDLDSDMRWCYGAGMGVRVPLSEMSSVSPRFDIRFVPSAPEPSAGRQAITDFGLMFSFKL